MKSTNTLSGLIWVFSVVTAVCAALAARAAEVELVNDQTPWRTYFAVVTVDARARKPADRERISALPPEGWTKRDFDDSCWARYMDDLSEVLGGYGCRVNTGGHTTTWPALLCMRTCFGISDPAQAKDVKVTVTCLGGGVVYVNGTEVGRGYMPQGKIEPRTPAERYPIEAYVVGGLEGMDPDVADLALGSAAPLPYVQWPPAKEWKERYEKRIRTFTVDVPSGVLAKGRNVVAVELHRARPKGPMPRGRGWGHMGIHQVKVTSASGKGAIPYAEAVKGVHVWSANTVDQVVESLSQKSLLRRGFFHVVMWPRGQPVKGVQMGNPFDPVLPVKMVAPRNGVTSGQTVLSDLSGLSGVTAKLGILTGPGRATIPAEAVEIRFAVQDSDVHYCDDLVVTPPEGVKTLPVWLVVRVPKDQAPGWYTSALKLGANQRDFSVPVRLLVSGFTVCDARDFQSQVSVIHSPEAVAARYKVEPWSDAHFKLMEKTFELMGQLGNDVVYVPVVQPSQLCHETGLIRWVKAGSGLGRGKAASAAQAGYRPDFSAFEKYLDAYLKYCAPPLAISLVIWDERSATEVAHAYEGSAGVNLPRTPKTPFRVTLYDPKTGKMSGMEPPRITGKLGGEPGEEPRLIAGKGSEAFWKPMLDGVHKIVKKRGWSERVILLGIGGDIRPSQKMGEILRQWAPYARWNIFSHFSGDPGTIFHKTGPGVEALKKGKLIAVGDLEVGLKEWPAQCACCASVAHIEKWIQQPREFLELGNHRWHWAEWSPPMFYRTLGLLQLRFTRVGMDFWDRWPRAGKVQGSVPVEVLAAGPEGAIPTVRFQLLRQSVQDVEAKLAILKALPNLPAEQQKACRAFLDDLRTRYGVGDGYLSQQELSLDWPAYVAKMYELAAEISGAKTVARWEDPPGLTAVHNR